MIINCWWLLKAIFLLDKWRSDVGTYVSGTNLLWDKNWKMKICRGKIVYTGTEAEIKVICVGIKTSKKDDLCWLWSRENVIAEIRIAA